MVRTEICLSCKKEFETDNSTKKFCSEDCRIAYDKIKEFNARNGLVEDDKNKFLNFLKLRFEVFKRDNFTCVYCGRSPKEDGVKIVVDHILPKSKGGNDLYDNLATSCEECNSGKSDVLLSERIVKKDELINIVTPQKCFKCGVNIGKYKFEDKPICSDCLDRILEEN
jgi:CRISPR/Cas system Type II protein with McrA/HNH and RuvC-like nuclease domain